VAWPNEIRRAAPRPAFSTAVFRFKVVQSDSKRFKVIQTKKSTPPQGPGPAVGAAVVIEDPLCNHATLQPCNPTIVTFHSLVAPKSDEGGFGAIRSYSELFGVQKIKELVSDHVKRLAAPEQSDGGFTLIFKPF
jgi:hypothetical protein